MQPVYNDKLLTQTLTKIQDDFHNAISMGGALQQTSLIRSKKLINHIHEYIKKELVLNGINPTKIYPPIGASNPELNMYGFLKSKSQDITILPSTPEGEIIGEGVLKGQYDRIGKKISENSISINVRSQLSSLEKNFDTLFERTFAEPLNLHLRLPNLVMGEVYMLPLNPYDDKFITKRKIEWTKRFFPVKYIPAFKELNGRVSVDKDYYKYERLCLLIVNFSNDKPEVIFSAKQLFEHGCISNDQQDQYSLEGMDIFTFVKDLLLVYAKRHGNLSPLK